MNKIDKKLLSKMSRFLSNKEELASLIVGFLTDYLTSDIESKGYGFDLIDQEVQLFHKKVSVNKSGSFICAYNLFVNDKDGKLYVTYSDTNDKQRCEPIENLNSDFIIVLFSKFIETMRMIQD